MAIISAKYLYAMVFSLFITILTFQIGKPETQVDNFKETMDKLTTDSHISLQLAKMRVDTIVARTIRENTK